ncbi:hypothetical protein ALC56_13424 [Trachymyrmex septentrionalis]|uniref:Uncharacterized protein n=1 Tax=Trachymyrmex septentrionalis TaxID=34720 RepID=A0A195EUX4_9HYME|nr:hypothetical protein ALC56_13424 [Trachymyrmex septentrionalis]
MAQLNAFSARPPLTAVQPFEGADVRGYAEPRPASWSEREGKTGKRRACASHGNSLLRRREHTIDKMSADRWVVYRKQFPRPRLTATIRKNTGTNIVLLLALVFFVVIFCRFLLRIRKVSSTFFLPSEEIHKEAALVILRVNCDVQRKSGKREIVQFPARDHVVRGERRVVEEATKRPRDKKKEGEGRWGRRNDDISRREMGEKGEETEREREKERGGEGGVANGQEKEEGEGGRVKHEERVRLLCEWQRDRRGKRKRTDGVAGRRGEIGHKKLEEKLR